MNSYGDMSHKAIVNSSELSGIISFCVVQLPNVVFSKSLCVVCQCCLNKVMACWNFCNLQRLRGQESSTFSNEIILKSDPTFHPLWSKICSLLFDWCFNYVVQIGFLPRLIIMIDKVPVEQKFTSRILQPFVIICMSHFTRYLESDLLLGKLATQQTVSFILSFFSIKSN